MKVLFIQKEGGIFGAENYHLNIIPALIKEGIRIEFLRLYTTYQLGRDSEFVKRLQILGVTVHQVEIGRIPRLGDIRKIAEIIKKGGYSVVHSHLIHADFYAAIIKTFYKVQTKFVSTKHGYDNSFTAKFGFDASKQTKTPYYLISKWSESKFDKSFTISQGLFNFFCAIRLTSSQKMRVIPYGFDLPVLENRNERDYRVSPVQICIAGRLVEFKGHHWAFEAVKQLVPVFPEIKLVVIGTGNFEERLKQLVHEIGIAEHVEFLGYRNDVPYWMKYSDVILVPSRAEGFGVVFLEAFNAQTPVVAFDVPAANELIEHGKKGLLARPYDTKEMAAHVRKLIEEPAYGEALAREAYKNLLTSYSLSSMVSKTIAFYREVLSI